MCFPRETMESQKSVNKGLKVVNREDKFRRRHEGGYTEAISYSIVLGDKRKARISKQKGVPEWKRMNEN